MTSPAFIIAIYKQSFRPRTVVFVAATFLLHILALQSTNWKDWSVNQQPSDEKIVRIQLHPQAPAVESAAIIPSHNQTVNKAKVKNKSTSITEPSEAMAAPEFVSTLENTDVAIQKDEDKVADTASEETHIEDVREDAFPVPEPATYTVKTPESVKIEMALVRTKPDTRQSYGVGSIQWIVEGEKYNMSIEAGLDLLITSINLYKLSSEGRVDKFGIMPDLSTEMRRTRAATATHFHHDDKTISFSASSKTVAMQDAAQDKASFLMHLASIGYADEKQFYAGREIEIQVAEERDATVFQFLVVGKEEINIKLGKISAWHLLRAPRPGSYNSQLDIWLAPEFGWYPVQIRNTESNGTITEQTATKVMQNFKPEG